MANLLGVDFGTTNVKAVVFSEDGDVLSSAAARTPIRSSGTCGPNTIPRNAGRSWPRPFARRCPG